MIDTKELAYSKACVELNEIIKCLPLEFKNKIPKNFLNNLQENMDSNYTFKMDCNKDLDKQDYMIETQAMYIELYQKYLADKSERNFWEKYNKICANIIEEEKSKKYNPDDIFKKNTNSKENSNTNVSKDTLLIEYKEPFFIRFKNFIFKMLHINN